MAILSRLLKKLSLSVLALFFVVAMGEGIFRIIKFDFLREEQTWRNVPIYYRFPIVPTGDVFFRRSGPDQWTGQVLNSQVKERGILPNPYIDEPVVTVEYDHRGFRNKDHLSDWSIAVAGDSFTELGYLPHEQLFTSVLARLLKMPVLNLGTSYTGPLTQLHYLQDYGIAASTMHTVIMFFEGNDLLDLDNEYKALTRWKETGQRDRRAFKKQPSLVIAIYQSVRRIVRAYFGRSGSNRVTGYFKSSRGNIPVTLGYSPPAKSQLSEETMHQLNYFFSQYAEFGEKNRQTTWLAYVPCKRRALHDQIEFSASASEEIKNWQPNDLPYVISGLCDQYGIKFINLTPVLVGKTNNDKQLLYNSIYDSHFNSQGSLIVGQELARHFSGQNH